MQVNLDRLGEWTPEDRFTVKAEHAAQYAAATNDANRAYRERITPPVFAVVPVGKSVVAALKAVISDYAVGNAATVHGEQDMFFHRPLRVGSTVVSRAASIGIHGKSTGTTIVTKTETREENGSLLNEQYFTQFMRGVFHDGRAGEGTPAQFPSERADDEPTSARVDYMIDEDQTFRYADAALDHHPFHLDPAEARAAGFPGIIVHGLCTLAFAGRGIVEGTCNDDVSRLTRLAGRFSRPLIPGQVITVAISSAETGERAHKYSYDVIDSSGASVVTRGWAEVAG